MIRVAAATAALCLAAASQAQEAIVDVVDVASTAKRDAIDRNVAPDTDVRTGLAGSGVQLLAGTDSTNVTLAASRTWDTASATRLGYAQASLVVNAPITDKDKGEGAFLTEGGLAQSLSVQDRSPGHSPATRRASPHQSSGRLCSTARSNNASGSPPPMNRRRNAVR